MEPTAYSVRSFLAPASGSGSYLALDSTIEYSVDNEEKPGKPRAPKWATQTFRRFVDESERLVRIVHLCTRGIAVVREMPKAIEVLARVEDKDEEPETQARLAQARQEAELADKEVKQEFPLLHGLGTVALWSLLEAAVLEFVTEWFKNQANALQTEPVCKLRVRIGDYELLRGDERFAYLAALLDREVSAGLRNGTERFESLLRPFTSAQLLHRFLVAEWETIAS